MKKIGVMFAGAMVAGAAVCAPYNPENAIVDVGKTLTQAWSQDDYSATDITANGFALSVGTSYYNGIHYDAGTYTFDKCTIDGMPGASLPAFKYNGQQWSFVAVNTTGRDLTGGYITVPGEAVHPNELLIHPCDDIHHFYVSCITPTAGCYRVVMEVRDLDGAGNELGRGVEASIRKARDFNVIGFKVCSAESGDEAPSTVTLDIPCVELAAGERIAFSIGNNGHYGYDLTVVRAYIFAGERPKGNEVINIDVDGEAPGDAEEGHVWETSDESLYFASAGTFWNSLYVKGSVVSFGTNTLCYANGKRSGVGITFATKSGNSNINFDCFPDEATNSRFPKLSRDYFYMYEGEDCNITISGLKPGGLYDLVFYGRVGDGWRMKFDGFEASAQSDGDAYFMRADPDRVVNGRMIIISGVPADENGEIRGATYTTSGAPVVFYGMQIRGRFVDPGLILIIR